MICGRRHSNFFFSGHMKTCAACTAAVLSHAVPLQRRCPMGCESATAIRVFT